MRGFARCVVVSGVLLATVGMSLAADEAKPARGSKSLPMDWSHRHMIFSHPLTTEQAVRTQRDFRYTLQQRQHETRPMAKLRVGDNSRVPRRRRRKLHSDWAVDLGPGASTGAGVFPAKFAFETDLAHCVAGGNPDFVVYGTGVPGVSAA